MKLRYLHVSNNFNGDMGTFRGLIDDIKCPHCEKQITEGQHFIVIGGIIHHLDCEEK